MAEKVGKKQAGTPDPIIEKLSSNSLVVDFNAAKQCFLLDHAEFLGEQSASFKNKEGFKNVVAIADSDISTLLTRLNKPSEDVRKFLNITPLEYSRFVPKIKLYKVIYSGARSFVGEAPIPFSTDSHKSIESILASGGARGDDAGIVEFSINHENSDPFTAKMVNGSLKILFQNGASLTKDRVINISSAGGGTTPFRFSDLISRRGQSPREFAGYHYRIRADIGYEIPANQSDDLSEKLIEELESMNLSMILELLDYDLSFEQNGAVTLEINYRSYIESVLEKSTYDIFTLTSNPSFDKMLDESTAKSKRIVESHLKSKLNGKLNDDGTPNEASKEWYKSAKEFDKAKETIENNESARNYEAGRNKVAKYSRIVSHMFDNDKIRRMTIKKNDLIYYSPEYSTKMKEEVSKLGLADFGVGVFANIESTVASGAVAIARSEVGKQDVMGQGGGSIVKGSGSDLNEEYAKKAMRTVEKEEDLKPHTAEEVKRAAAETITDLNAQLSKEDEPDLNPDAMSVYWFYLGDLLTAVIDTAELSEKLNEDHVGFMFANAMLPNRQKSANITLLDIPISLEMFMQFFKKLYIDKDVTRFSLNKFIQDVVQQLLLSSVNQKCQGESIKRPLVLKTTVIEVGTFGSVDGSVEGRNPFAPYSSGSQKRIYSTSSGGRTLQFLTSPAVLKKRNANQRYFFTLVYVVESGLPSALNGDPIADHQKGIYHFYIGADRGVVKDVSFSKAKKNFQAEAMAQKAVASGDEFAEIFNLFNVDVEMIGNTLLKPGSYIYLNPTLTGVGADTSRTLGLGGYYFVLGVSSELNKDGWKTSIKADSAQRLSSPAQTGYNPASGDTTVGRPPRVEEK